MSDHKEREHAVLSASGAHRWMDCTPSARLEEQFPDQPSEAADEGTLAHELAEAKLQHYFDTEEFNRRKLTNTINRLKKRDGWADEMDRYTEEYLDFVKAAALAFPKKATVKIEHKLDLSAYVPESFGTADCILISGCTLHIIDFKYGKSPEGRVEAEGNPQLSLYALGAYEMCKMLYPIDTIRLSIVQPRLPDGISDWLCSLKELLAWGEYVKRRAALAWEGKGDFFPSEKTCRYCRARGRCRARANNNVELAFAVGKKPPLITNEELGKYLTQGEDIAKWLKDLQACALSECLAGKEVPGWKAVEGRGSRDWADLDTAFNALREGGIDDAILWERKPLTPPALEKVLGKKEFDLKAGNYVVKNPGKPTLARDTDKREAISNKVTAAEAFKD
ncbi:DUF2800 domain-containing protein [Hominifimenecus sp. rT4P-3]|uniref:DUF2800 domain-containing protein n=1 Tax=Hominifimenecus sp. rT4P-3 TaxID=3242979 RepID=UPI003DA5D896